MANYVLDRGYLMEGSAAVTAGFFVLKGVNSQKNVKVSDAAGALVYGVLMESADAAKVATGKAILDVRHLGIAPVVASAAITYGAEVATTATGKAATAATTNRVVGIALQSSSADGDIIDVLLVPAGRVVP